MRVSLVISILLFFAFPVLGQEEAGVETSPVEEEMATASFETKEVSESDEGTLSLEEDEGALIETASKEETPGSALSVGEEPRQDALEVYTNKLTYYGYQELSDEMYDEIYNYYSLSYPEKTRDWR